VAAYTFKPGKHGQAKKQHVMGYTKSEQIQEMFRKCRGNSGLDDETIESVCEKIENFSNTTTFSTYYSSFKHFLEWAGQHGVEPWSVTEASLAKYVRCRLDENVAVQTIKVGLSGVRKFSKLFGWKIADADAVISFLFTQS
jgi:hypothetical protein